MSALERQVAICLRDIADHLTIKCSLIIQLSATSGEWSEGAVLHPGGDLVSSGHTVGHIDISGDFNAVSGS